MRKKFYIPIFYIFIASFAKAQNIDAIHYKYTIIVSDTTDTIYGQAKITAIALKPLQRFTINLGSLQESGKGMQVENIFDTYKRSLLFSFTNDTIHISLHNKINKGDSVLFTIEYKGIPPDGLIISKNKYGHRTFFADNWPDRAHQWIPCIDNPADKASVEFITVTPAHYKVISNGILQEEVLLDNSRKKTYWKEDIPLPTKVMVIGVADFDVQQLPPADSISISSWSFPENTNSAVEDYGFATNIIQFFSRYIAPFPYKKLANVQSKTIFGGMENAGAIFYYENSVDGLHDNEDLIAHEIAHQWFGDMATEKSYAHLWLSEGFATYLTNIYLESKYGTSLLNSRMNEDRKKVIAFSREHALPVVDSISPVKILLNANSYQKGSWVLHMLRRELGDSIFHTSIKKYYQEFAGKNAETADLEKVFEEVAKKDLSVFFRQWLYTPELPILKTSWTYNHTEKKLLFRIVQLQQKRFYFPLQIAIITATHKTIYKTLSVQNNYQDFSIPMAEDVTDVILDPNTSLLFQHEILN